MAKLVLKKCKVHFHCCHHRGKHRKGKLLFTVFYPHLKLYLKGITHMVLTDTQKVNLSISPVDAKGKPAKIDGVPSWTSSDETILSLVPAADGLSAVAVAGDPGHAQVSVTADADLGEGVTGITGTLEVDVEAGEAVSLNITAGAPEPQ